MISTPIFKKGDTFALACTYKIDGVPSSLTGISIACQVRTACGELVSTLTVTVSDQGLYPGQFSLTDPTTIDWPAAGLRADIQFTSAGIIVSTDTFLIPVVQDITQ